MIDKAVVEMVINGLLESLYMISLSTVLAYILGMPLGILLSVTDKEGISPIPWLNGILGVVINILRSIPFLILLVFVTPFTRFLLGTTIGPTATVVALVISASPFVARMVESSLKEVDRGVVEAAQSMGASSMQIVTRVLLTEAKPSLLIGAAITIVTIIGYSAMAGFTAGGGLGDIAVRYGYYRYENGMMLVTVAILVIIVQIFQELGLYLARKADKRSNANK